MEKINFDTDVFKKVEKLFAYYDIEVVDLGYIAHSYWIIVNCRVIATRILNKIYQECNLEFYVATWDSDKIGLCFDEKSIL